jgi:predicted CXXCH cytochrome family protein
MSTFSKLPIYLLAILLVILAVTNAFALGMSSKRDCVVCHVMWLDDFRTDEETLIEWQPGNVLMEDTQGVVSSEEICYSCHDGYVQDSRHITWSHNRHKIFVKPSDKITIPPELPLSNKGEIYCGTCHSAHGKGAAPHGDPTGRTSLFRETNVDSSLCEKCHSDKANYRRHNGHPLHKVSDIKPPERLFKLGSKHAIDENVVICQSCHRIHGARGRKLLVVDNDNSSLCVICHGDKKDLIDTKHDIRTTLPDEKNLKEQTAFSGGPCSACHTPHNAAGKKLWSRPYYAEKPMTQLCFSCHGEDTSYDIKRTGKHTHPVDIRPEKAEIPDNLPLYSFGRARQSEGTVECFTCHDVHRWDPGSEKNRGGKKVEGDVTNSFLRMSNESGQLCLQCHKDKQQINTSDHNLIVTAPEETNIQGLTATETGPCGVCHIPHNAVSVRLWSKEISGESDFVTQLCTTCHNEKGAASKKLLGDYYHPVDVNLNRLYLTSTLPLFDADGNKTMDGKIVCITCHDPHKWNPDGPVSNYNSKNIEGDATNSFLRKANYPSSDLCESCHADKALVDGTDHDLNITAPEAKNLLSQTVKESGQCGACHLVHNSPNRLKLWAQPYGYAGPNEDMINSLCNSCHARGGIAENKIPLIATHPQDKLINNIMRCNRNQLDFSPLYDQVTGEETNVGNISCPSCHNAHQWSPIKKVKGTNKNIEGSTTNSFLRNVSYNNICIDCHGLDALFRYKYFHDPEERVEPEPKGLNISK